MRLLNAVLCVLTALLLAVCALSGVSIAGDRGGIVGIPEKDWGEQVRRSKPIGDSRPSLPEKDWKEQQRRNPLLSDGDLKQSSKCKCPEPTTITKTVYVDRPVYRTLVVTGHYWTGYGWAPIYGYR